MTAGRLWFWLGVVNSAWAVAHAIVDPTAKRIAIAVFVTVATWLFCMRPDAESEQ